MKVQKFYTSLVLIVITLLAVVSSRHVMIPTLIAQESNVNKIPTQVDYKNHIVVKRHVPLETTTPKLDSSVDDVKIIKVKEKALLFCTMNFCSFQARE